MIEEEEETISSNSLAFSKELPIWNLQGALRNPKLLLALFLSLLLLQAERATAFALRILLALLLLLALIVPAAPVVKNRSLPLALAMLPCASCLSLLLLVALALALLSLSLLLCLVFLMSTDNLPLCYVQASRAILAAQQVPQRLADLGAVLSESLLSNVTQALAVVPQVRLRAPGRRVTFNC